MIRGVWHSITYEGEVPVRETFIDERGFAFGFDRRDWWVHDDQPVYKGEHVQAVNERVESMCQEMRDLALELRDAPDDRHMEILLDALR